MIKLNLNRYRTISRYIALVLLLFSTALFIACSEESETNGIILSADGDTLTFVSQKLNISAEAAEAVLSELEKYGSTDGITYIVKSSDYETGEEYYVVWLKNGSVSLYMDGDRVKSIEKGAHGKTEAETTDLSTVETTETTFQDTFIPPVDTTVNTDRYDNEEEPDIPEIEEPDTTEAIITTAPETTKEEAPVLELKNVFYSEEVEQGSKAYFSAKGKVGVTYRIDVIYPSGKSSAKGLGEQKTNSFGALYWEWKVSTQTTVGTHKIVVSCGDSEAVYYFTVTPKSTSSKVTTATTKTPETEAPTTDGTPISGGYVANVSSKKFHLPDCRYAKSMKEENRAYVDSRDKAIKMGLEPCKVCNP